MESAFSPGAVRPARQAGRFYDGDAGRLRREVTRMLGGAAPAALEGRPVALLAPHAGYIYSGHVAAAAYRTVLGRAVERVLVLAPSHYLDFTGAALSSARAFATPLGEVPLDREAGAALSGQAGFAVADEAHESEHAVEVQLPFLQVALGRGFEVLPLTLGRPPGGTGLDPLAGPLLELLRGRVARGQDWLIVASSDTYHGYDPGACAANDERLKGLIERMEGEEIVEAGLRREVAACGWLALGLAAGLARGLGARRGVVLKRSDSQGGSGTGPAGQYIVGYVAAAFV